MILSLTKKYLKLILFYIIVLIFIFFKGEKFLLSYVYYFIYLLTYILINENLKLSKYNRDIVLLFKIFYFYLAFILLIPFFLYTIMSSPFNNAAYFYADIILTSLILVVSLYLLFYALGFTQFLGYSKSLIVVFIICIAFSLLNFYSIVTLPDQLNLQEIWPIYSKKVYYFKSLSIFSLMIFWIFYYRKHFVLSEYLNLIIFFFMLSNILDALYYIGVRFQFSIFRYGQYFTLLINLLFVAVWFWRLRYLNKN